MRCSEDKTEELAHVYSRNKCGGDGMHSNWDNQVKIEFWTASCASGPIGIDFQELLVYAPVGAYVFLFE
jgi:hypothetical protein